MTENLDRRMPLCATIPCLHDLSTLGTDYRVNVYSTSTSEDAYRQTSISNTNTQYLEEHIPSLPSLIITISGL